MSDEEGRSHNNTQHSSWSEQSKRWKNVGQPTRPGHSDQQIMLKLASDALGNQSPEIVVLGVTPEVINLPWPSKSRLRAYDISTEMINSVWKSNPSIALCDVGQGDWKSLPVESQSVDLVCGDGCFTALQGLQDCYEVSQEISRLLKPGGRAVLRYFVRSDHPESHDTIANQAFENQINFFGTLKWRLAMSLCDPDSSTVRPNFIHQKFSELFPDRLLLNKLSGWPLGVIETIDSYANMEGVFTFPTLGQLQDCLQTFFKIETISHGDYELAEHCPTLSLSVR